MLMFFSVALFLFSLWIVGLWGYHATVIEPREIRRFRDLLKLYCLSGLHETLDLCDYCHGEKVKARGQVIEDLAWPPCPRCKGQGVVKVVKRKSDCHCEICAKP